MKENLTTILTGVKDALNAALAAITNGQAALFNQANTEKAQLLALLADMQETREATKEFGTICGEAGAALLDIEEKNFDVSANLKLILDDFNDIPVMPIEKFVDFCDECGREISEDEDYVTDGIDHFVCAGCLTKEEDEPTEDETETEDETDGDAE